MTDLMKRINKIAERLDERDRLRYERNNAPTYREKMRTFRREISEWKKTHTPEQKKKISRFFKMMGQSVTDRSVLDSKESKQLYAEVTGWFRERWPRPPMPGRE